MQYLISINAVIVAEWDNDPEDLAENIYAMVTEIAASEDHLLQLEVAPVPLPQDSSAFPVLPAATDDSAQEEGGQETL
jgi:hypothetical protein